MILKFLHLWLIENVTLTNFQMKGMLDYQTFNFNLISTTFNIKTIIFREFSSRLGNRDRFSENLAVINLYHNFI